jgi:hypothetical protein
MLADLESLEKRVDQAQKRARTGEKEAKEALVVMEPALAALRAGRPARSAPIAPDRRRAFRGLQLLTGKPVMYIANVGEADAATGNALSRAVEAHAAAEGAPTVVISAAIEAEIAQLTDPEEKAEFLATLGLDEPGLHKVIRAGYELLDLVTYFTAGPKASRAWTIKRGTKAPQAAGVIHTDFERGFIRAETIAYDDYVGLGGEAAAKEAGRMRQEGKEYVVQDGDVLLFRFNV